MAYDRKHVRVSYLFTIGGTDEVADTGFSLTDPGDTAFNAESYLALWGSSDILALATAYAAFMAGHGAILGWAQYSNLVGVKLAAVDVNGHYLGEAVTQTVSGTAGGNVTAYPQLTQVLTLHSGDHFGRANHGRMYLPHTSPAIDSAHPWLSGTNQHNMALDAQTFVRALNAKAASLRSSVRVCNLSKLGSGTTKFVKYVGIGRITDTQRRRRNRLTEDIEYQSV